MSNREYKHRDFLATIQEGKEWKYVSRQVMLLIGAEKYTLAMDRRNAIKAHLATILHEQHYFTYLQLQNLIYDIFSEALTNLEKAPLSQIKMIEKESGIAYEMGGNEVQPVWIPKLSETKKQVILQYNDFETISNQAREVEQKGKQPVAKGKFSFRDVVYDAFLKGTSDIHLIPKEEYYHVFFRMSGDIIKQPKYMMSLDDGYEFATQVAIDATEFTKGKFSSDNLLVAQEGRLEYPDMGAQGVDVRLEFIPDGMMGKRLTIIARLLKRQRIEAADFSAKGYHEKVINVIEETSKRSGGLNIISGITGSGKSTLVADIMATIDSRKRIYTIEDPIEYFLAKDNITQHQIYQPPKKDASDDGKQMGFSEYTKALKRADPDIVNIGEMRNDPALVKAVFEMANAGQLIYTTVHIRSAFEIFHALEKIFEIPFHSTVPLVFLSMNLKLSKKLCDHCKVPDIKNSVNKMKLEAIEENLPYEFKTRLHDFLRQSDAYETYLRGPGCAHCDGGYKGRVPIYEYFRPNVDLVEWMLSARPTRYQIEQKACVLGIGENKLSVFIRRLIDGEVDTSDDVISSIM